MTTVAIIQARHTSSRLPGKMTLPLAGIPVIEHIVRRIRTVESIDSICITIPEGKAQAPLAEVIATLDGVHLSRGPEEHLLTRFSIAARETGADVIVRLWGDCPAVDPSLVRSALDAFQSESPDWSYLSDKSGYPLGSEHQIISRAALDAAAAAVTDDADLEAVHSWFDRHPADFRKLDIIRPGSGRPSPLQVLLDTADDYAKLCKIFDALYPDDPLFGFRAVEELAAREPAWFEIKEP